MDKTLLKTALNGVALAVGVAIIVMQILGSLGIGTATTLLGVGLTALALAGLQK
jgi:hypothetical protein